MPTAPYLKLLQRDAIAARGPDAPPPSGAGLRLVTETERSAALPAPAAPTVLDGVHVAGVRLDRQQRLSVRNVLAQLGWKPGLILDATVDDADAVLWLRRPTDEVVVESPDGGCACGCTGGCEPAPVVVPLPGVTRPAFEPASVDAKRQLVLTPGLVRAVGLEAPGDAVIVAVRQLDAVAICSVAAVLRGGLAAVTDLSLATLSPSTELEDR